MADNRETMALTQEMVKNPDGLMVKGCRTMHGYHRGLSAFDGINPRFPFDWYAIDEGTEIPPGLAVTKDGEDDKNDLVRRR